MNNRADTITNESAIKNALACLDRINRVRVSEGQPELKKLSTARVTHRNNCITINPGGWKDVSITCYTNGEIEDFAYISTNGDDLTPPKPSWKRAYAIEEAKKYATAFLGNFPPTILATPFVE